MVQKNWREAKCEKSQRLPGVDPQGVHQLQNDIFEDKWIDI